MANDADGSNDANFMTRAIELARAGQGWVEPNPMVGAVVVKARRIIGQGFHRRFGGPHAEVEAIEDCRRQGEPLDGATMYVTLEPCSHHGQTPPCVDAIVPSGVQRVVVAMVDPSDHGSGRGIKRLTDAGIEVQTGVLEEAARRLNAPFIKRITTGLPWVILKWAQTLDGHTATSTGQSKWISNDQSRRRVHRLRARVDAVMTGIGTALADNPRLTARGVEIKRTARRVVIGDPNAIENQRPDLTLLHEEGPPVEFYDNQRDLRPLLARLGQAHQATNVLVEAGGGLNGALLDQGLVDQILAFVSPKLLGDPTAKSAVRGLRTPEIAKALPLTLNHVERLGDDVLLDYHLFSG